MDVLIACEESQRVCAEFRKRGHNAYSCDIVETSGNNPEWHIRQNVIDLLNGYCAFVTQDLQVHYELWYKRWDIIIAFPPCTHLAVSGAKHFEKKRLDGSQRQAIDFFCTILNADCEKIAIENPVGIISGKYIKKWFPDLASQYKLPIKPNQIIQPYYFGDNHRKTTCLWLKNLPKLKPDNIVEPTLISYKCKNGKVVIFDEYMVHTKGNRATHRSKTFPGIARAMAEQWG